MAFRSHNTRSRTNGSSCIRYGSSPVSTFADTSFDHGVRPTPAILSNNDDKIPAAHLHSDRRRRVINSPEELLPGDITEWKIKRYKLNEENALLKKLKASNRDTLYKAEENNGTFNITCQAGLYELFRRASCWYYARFRTAGLSPHILVHTDQNNSIVQVTFKIKTYGGQTSYAVDMYHTKSSILISGRHKQKFIDNDWHHIMDEIQEMNNIRKETDPDLLNKSMQECLTEVIQLLQNQKTKKTTHATKKDPFQKELQHLYEASQELSLTNSNNDPQVTPTSYDNTTPDATAETNIDTTGTDETTKKIEAISDKQVMLDRASPPHLPTQTTTASREILNGDEPIQIEAHHPQAQRDISLPTPQDEDEDTPYTPQAEGGDTPGLPQDEEEGTPDTTHNTQHRSKTNNTETNLRYQAETLEYREEILAIRERQLRQDMARKENDLTAREKKLSILQREVLRREKEVESKEEQHQAMKLHMAALERRTRELSEERNILTARITALETDHQDYTSKQPEHSQTPGTQERNTNCSTPHGQQPMPTIIISPHFHNNDCSRTHQQPAQYLPQHFTHQAQVHPDGTFGLYNGTPPQPFNPMYGGNPYNGYPHQNLHFPYQHFPPRPQPHPSTMQWNLQGQPLRYADTRPQHRNTGTPTAAHTQSREDRATTSNFDHTPCTVADAYSNHQRRPREHHPTRNPRDSTPNNNTSPTQEMSIPATGNAYQHTRQDGTQRQTKHTHTR